MAKRKTNYLPKEVYNELSEEGKEKLKASLAAKKRKFAKYSELKNAVAAGVRQGMSNKKTCKKPYKKRREKYEYC